MARAVILLHFKNNPEMRIERKCDCKDFGTIYDLLMLATDGDHEIAQILLVCVDLNGLAQYMVLERELLKL